MAAYLPTLQTDRLRIRPLRAADLPPLAAMNADPLVMRHFPTLLDRKETASAVRRVRAHRKIHGFAWLAVELPGEAPFIGIMGLAVPRFAAPFMPAVEIGWRLTPPYWGRGLAQEGARAVLSLGFKVLGLAQIVAMTAVANIRSRRVMEAIGMTHDPGDDFLHPLLPAGHPLQRHVLYRLTASRFAALEQHAPFAPADPRDL